LGSLHSECLTVIGDEGKAVKSAKTTFFVERNAWKQKEARFFASEWLGGTLKINTNDFKQKERIV